MLSHSLQPAKGKVYLVGAAPGDPDLLTVKAVRTLGRADVVLHDALVSAEVLASISPRARVINVGKRLVERASRKMKSIGYCWNSLPPDRWLYA